MRAEANWGSRQVCIVHSCCELKMVVTCAVEVCVVFRWFFVINIFPIIIRLLSLPGIQYVSYSTVTVVSYPQEVLFFLTASFVAANG